MSRVAVVLLNLGGPDRPEAVQPFLFNLFNDPAILTLPKPLRWPLAQLISRRRAPIAREIYRELGGGSPLLPNTEVQARALEAELRQHEGLAVARVFVAMRYWRPRSDETAAQVKAFAPERVVLLPLYPQYSTTTSGSSLADWSRAAAAVGLEAPTRAVCCYPSQTGLIAELAALLRAGLEETRRAGGRPRVLFSAHGLPKRVVARGDPYQWQVERTAAAVVAALGEPGLDWTVCYQSRVGPLAWLEPATDAEIRRAGRDRVSVVVAPLAFVSEHSETLVELDIEYRRLAEEHGVPAYVRVPTVSVGARFIGGLGELVEAALAEPRPLCSELGGRLCPPRHPRCAQAAGCDAGRIGQGVAG